MISTYVRRLRLAHELRQLREEAGLTHEQLARKVGTHRQKISKLENGRTAPDTHDVNTVLAALEVEGQRWEEIMTIAHDAASRGWWEAHLQEMGPRQALYANLEAGAQHIAEYQQLVPGLMQTPEYTRARLNAKGWSNKAAGSTADGIVHGRLERQRMLHRPSGPAYRLILDEVAIRRPTAPPHILAAQFRHIADQARLAKIEVRVLPVGAVISSFAVPLCTFSIYDYPSDPPVVAVETVTTDTILTEPVDVARYTDRYGLLREASMTPQESIDLLTETAQQLLSATQKDRA